MTFKGKIDIWWYLVPAFLNGVAIAAVIYKGGVTRILAGNFIVLVVLDLYFIPVIFKNEVTVNKKYVIVKFGLLTKEIPIEGITRIRVMKNYSGSFAASFNRIGIESRRLSTVFIAPEDKESFIRELMRKNRKIKYLL